MSLSPYARLATFEASAARNSEDHRLDSSCPGWLHNDSALHVFRARYDGRRGCRDARTRVDSPEPSKHKVVLPNEPSNDV
jgi:hypothetical protein